MKLTYRSIGIVIIMAAITFVVVQVLLNGELDLSSKSAYQSLYGSHSLSSFTAASVAHQVTKPPSMLLLLELDIIKRVVDDRRLCLPDHLLQDQWVVDRIDQDNQGDTERFYKEVFKEWLKGPATWRTLIDMLYKCKLRTLADDIADVIHEKVLDLKPIPYSHSLEVPSFVKWIKSKYMLESVVDSPLLRSYAFYKDMKFVNLAFTNVSGNQRFTMEQFLYKVHNFEHKHSPMVISGDPGSGKTTLMRYLAKEWAKGNVLQSCQILLLFYLGRCKNQYQNLKDLLTNTDYSHLYVEHVANIIQGNHGEGACFLLDAYDEKNLEPDFLTDIIHLNKLPHSLRIVTTRPSFAQMLERGTHLRIIGFSDKYVEFYASQLPKITQNSLHQLWQNHSGIREACRSPLYLSLIVYIVSLNPGRRLSLSTRTQLYHSVMDSLITHYQGRHHKWNAGSLRDCIIKKPHCSDNILCCAFNTLQRAAFDVIFSERENFEMEEYSLLSSLKRLSIVSVHHISSYEVTYSFAHHTFTEFFAALHLTTIPQNERLAYITQYSHEQVVWQFYFGLMSKYYPENITAIYTSLKRCFSRDYPHPLLTTCHQYCSAENLVVLTEYKLEIIRELGWTARGYKQLFTSTGIIVNSSVFIANHMVGGDAIHLVSPLLEVATIHKLCYDHSMDFVIAVEDWTQTLSNIHLDFIQRAIDNNFVKAIDPVVLPETTFVTAYRFRSFSPFPLLPSKVFRHLTHVCMSMQSFSNKRDSDVWEKFFRSAGALLSGVTNLDIGVHVNSFSYSLLSKFTSIKALAITHDGQSMTTFQLSDVLRKPSELHSLKLFSVPCKDIQLFLDGLTGLKRLQISYSNFDECTDGITHHLWKNKQLRALRIAHTEVEIHKLASVLSMAHSNLEELHLLFTGLTDNDVSVLSVALRNLTSLKSLWLASSSMTDISVRILVHALNSESHPNFHELLLKYGGVGRNIAYFSTLAQLTDLQSLKIHAIGEFKNMPKIVTVLGSLTQLRVLHWRGMSSFEEAEDSFIHAICNLTDLQELDLILELKSTKIDVADTSGDSFTPSRTFLVFLVVFFFFIFVQLFNNTVLL